MSHNAPLAGTYDHPEGTALSISEDRSKLYRKSPQNLAKLGEVRMQKILQKRADLATVFRTCGTYVDLTTGERDESLGPLLE